jgi:hypothetical protein
MMKIGVNERWLELDELLNWPTTPLIEVVI